jgi:hypothetical protein
MNIWNKKTNKLNEESKFGLEINIRKTKLMTVNNKKQPVIKIEGHQIENVEKFKCLGSIMTKEGGTEKDIETRVANAQNAFHMLNRIWYSSNLSKGYNIRIFNSNFNSVLLYGSETWKINKKLIKELQVFVNKYLRKIMKIWWPNKIRNERLWEIKNQETIEKTIKIRKWKWIGHTWRRPSNEITPQALEWNPPGKRNRGRYRNTWRRTVEKELAADRIRWRGTVEALCSIRSEEE